MAYNFLVETAVETIRKRYSNGGSPAMWDTVCVICSGSGNIYTGINVQKNNGNIPENIHAEIDAVNRMRADGETVVKAITLYNSCNISPILPCVGCINLIISLNPANINAEIVTPGGNINITDVGRISQNPAVNQRSVYINQMPQPGSAYMNQGMQNRSVYMNQMPQPGSAYMNQGMRNSPLHMNQMSQGAQNQSVYINQPAPKSGASIYMNAAPGGSAYMSSGMQSSAYMGQSGISPGVKSYSSGGESQQKNNILKNKLNNLLNDDE